MLLLMLIVILLLMFLMLMLMMPPEDISTAYATNIIASNVSDADANDAPC